MGPFTLISRGIFSAKTAKNRLIAANLAQEGVEIIRRFRDTNALTGCTNTTVNPPKPDWRGLVDTKPGCTTLFGGVSPGQDWEADITQTSLTPYSNPGQFLRFCKTQGFANYGLYAYSCSGDPSPLTSIFVRKINLMTPSGDELVTTVTPNVTIPRDDIMYVTVTVSWQEGSIGQRSLIQRDVLYNWR